MLLGQLGVIADSYPYAFLTFCSSLIQLVLMFVIMVGQDVMGEASDRRVIETANHTAVVLQQCRHLHAALTGQDAVLAGLVDRALTDPATASRSAPATHHPELGGAST